MRDESVSIAPSRLPASGATLGRYVVALIVGTALARIAVSAATGLGTGESYYIASARRLDLSYFDQPPLSLWLMHATLAATGSEDATVLRLPFIALFAVSTWLMYRLGALLFDERAGALAALLMNLSFVVSVGIGGWLQPDGPLVAAWLGTVLCLARLLFGTPPTRPAAWWLAAGALLGLALLSKYHALFIVLGLAACMATSADARRRLAGPWPWVALALAGLMLTPVLWWNMANDWASFRFQFGRGLPERALAPARLLFNVAGQALFLLPWIWAPLVWCLARALARGPVGSREWFLACIAAGPIAVFTLVSLWASVGLHFHWQAPGYLMLFPLLGAAAARALEGAHAVSVRRWLGASAAAIAIAAAAMATQAATGVATRLAPALFPDGDPAAELKDWRELRPALERFGLAGRPKLFVVTNRWHLAGKIDRALAGRLPVLCFSDDPRNIAFLNDHRRFVGHDAVIVTDPRFGGNWATRLLAPHFESLVPLGSVTIARLAAPAAELHLLLARGYRGNFPMPLPPPRPSAEPAS